MRMLEDDPEMAEPLADAHARHGALHGGHRVAGLRRPGAREVPPRPPGVRDGRGRRRRSATGSPRGPTSRWPDVCCVERLAMSPPAVRRGGRRRPLPVGGRPARLAEPAPARGRSARGVRIVAAVHDELRRRVGADLHDGGAGAGLRRRARPGTSIWRRGSRPGSRTPGSRRHDPRRRLRHLRPPGHGRAPVSTQHPGLAAPPQPAAAPEAQDPPRAGPGAGRRSPSSAGIAIGYAARGDSPPGRRHRVAHRPVETVPVVTVTVPARALGAGGGGPQLGELRIARLPAVDEGVDLGQGAGRSARCGAGRRSASR